MEGKPQNRSYQAKAKGSKTQYEHPKKTNNTHKQVIKHQQIVSMQQETHHSETKNKA